MTTYCFTHEAISPVVDQQPSETRRRGLPEFAVVLDVGMACGCEKTIVAKSGS